MKSKTALGIGLGFVLIFSSLVIFQNQLSVAGQEAVNPVDDGVSFDSYANETETSNETDNDVRVPTDEDIDPELTEENFDEFENPKAENPVDDGVTVVGELPIPVAGSRFEECKDELGNAFLLLHEMDPAAYSKVVKHLNGITCETAGTGVNTHTGISNIGVQKWSESTAFVSATLVHEACHVEQFERQNWFKRLWDRITGTHPYGEAVEIECIAEELKTLNNLGEDDAWKRRMIEDPEFRKLEENRYWENENRGTY